VAEDKLLEAEAVAVRFVGSALPVEVEFMEGTELRGIRPTVDPGQFGGDGQFAFAAAVLGQALSMGSGR